MELGGLKSEKVRKNHYREGYARPLDSKRVELDGENVEHMWEKVKLEMIESA